MARKIKWPNYSRASEIAWIKKHRLIMPLSIVKTYKQTLAKRIQETRKILDKDIVIGDVHTHTTFSDGINSVEEIKDMADAVGLDFVFITDHRTLRHKHYCCNEDGIWWGQEPPTSGREMVLLHPRKLFIPSYMSLADDFRLARYLSPFVFIPHPVGYAPDVRYSNKIIADLWTLGERFSMELLNGHGKLTHAYDTITEKAIHVWEKLLNDGRQVNIVGGSDAHISYSIGTAWTGVCGIKNLKLKHIIEALTKGHSFASEAPLLWLGYEDAIMGDAVFRPKWTKVRIVFVAADSAGLDSVRLIKDGKVVQKKRGLDTTKFVGSYECKVRNSQCHFRLECTASDQRKAFSSPLYIKPIC